MKNKEIWPNFFIVGAAKSGTTALYKYLNDTKGVYMSPVKETRFFHKPDSSYEKTISNRIIDEDKYLKLFSKVKDEKAIGEATPAYLRDPESPGLIHEKVPNAKIIIMLRNPIQRAYSHYLMKKTYEMETRTFHQVIENYISSKNSLDEIIDIGLYASRVKSYLDIFGAQNVKILFFEEFIKDTINQIREVLNFLGVDSEPPLNVGKVYNAYGEPRDKIAESFLANQYIWKIGAKIIPRKYRQGLKKKLFLKDKEKPKLEEEDIKILQKLYQEEVNNLKKILDMEFTWKWFE